MKKLILLLIISSFVLTTRVYSIESNTGTIRTEFTASQIINMKARDFAEATGMQLNWKEKLGYSMLRTQIKKQVRQGNLSPTDAVSMSRDQVEGEFNAGAFILGLLLGLIGFIIVLAAFDDKKAWKWALVGWASMLVLLIILVAV